MKESFIIQYPKTPAERKRWSSRYGMNAYYSGKHWAQRKADAEYWHMMVRSAMNSQKVRRKPFEKPVVITFYWNDRLDIDNHAVMGKMILDAMKGRIVNDDTRRWVKGVEHYFHDADNIKVVVSELK